jgi:hypothetical protein
MAKSRTGRSTQTNERNIYPQDLGMPQDAHELGTEGINLNGVVSRTPERRSPQTHTEWQSVGAGKHDESFDEDHPDIHELDCDIANAPAPSSQKSASFGEANPPGRGFRKKDPTSKR